MFLRCDKMHISNFIFLHEEHLHPSKPHNLLFPVGEVVSRTNLLRFAVSICKILRNAEESAEIPPIESA